MGIVRVFRHNSSSITIEDGNFCACVLPLAKGVLTLVQPWHHFPYCDDHRVASMWGSVWTATKWQGQTLRVFSLERSEVKWSEVSGQAPNSEILRESKGVLWILVETECSSISCDGEYFFSQYLSLLPVPVPKQPVSLRERFTSGRLSG
jgi:hypothetical protein